jgi:hypothetical protein
MGNLSSCNNLRVELEPVMLSTMFMFIVSATSRAATWEDQIAYVFNSNKS